MEMTRPQKNWILTMVCCSTVLIKLCGKTKIRYGVIALSSCKTWDWGQENDLISVWRIAISIIITNQPMWAGQNSLCNFVLFSCCLILLQKQQTILNNKSVFHLAPLCCNKVHFTVFCWKQFFKQCSLKTRI